jgi:hypothetical protein
MVSPCYCVVCAVRLQFKILWQGYIKKNKKNLRFHRRVYQRTITRRYFTELQKNYGIVPQSPTDIPTENNPSTFHRRTLPTESPTDLRTSRSARMSDTCPSAQIPTALPMYNTDGITDGFTHIPNHTHVWHVSVCTNTDRVSDGSKSLAGFSNFFWCAFQLISDGITDGI